MEQRHRDGYWKAKEKALGRAYEEKRREEPASYSTQHTDETGRKFHQIGRDQYQDLNDVAEYAGKDPEQTRRMWEERVNREVMERRYAPKNSESELIKTIEPARKKKFPEFEEMKPLRRK